MKHPTLIIIFALLIALGARQLLNAYELQDIVCVEKDGKEKNETEKKEILEYNPETGYAIPMKKDFIRNHDCEVKCFGKYKREEYIDAFKTYCN